MVPYLRHEGEDDDQKAPGETVLGTAHGHYDETGGVLCCDTTGVSLIIPKGAIKANCVQEVYFKVCRDDASRGANEGQSGEKSS